MANQGKSKGEILEAALAIRAAGTSIIPIETKKKKPAGWLLPWDKEKGRHVWKPFMSTIATEETVRGWFARGIEAFAAVGGMVSAGFVAIDFDLSRMYEVWRDLVGDLIDELVIQRSGRDGGGFHVIFRTPNSAKTEKLAQYEDENETDPKERIKCGIETKAEKGYIVLAPSLHPSGRNYEVIQGDLTKIPTIPQEWAEVLLAKARGLCEMPLTVQQMDQAKEPPKPKPQPRPSNGNPGVSSIEVIEQFNDAHDVAELLLAHGYTRHGPDKLTRPGSDATPGSVSIDRDKNRATHFSSNDALNDGKDRPYGQSDPFKVYAHFEHGGDNKKAVKTAAKLMGLSHAPSHNQPAAAAPPSTTLPPPASTPVWSNDDCEAPLIVENGSVAVEEEPHETNYENEGGPGYLLIPGPHTNNLGVLIEVGGDDFARTVLARVPRQAIFRRGGVPGELVGEQGQKTFRAVSVHDVRLLIDTHMSLGKWVMRGRGEAAHQELVFVACNKDHAELVLARASVDHRIPEIRVLTTFPVFVSGFTLAEPGFHNGVFYDQPLELRDLKPQTDPAAIRETFDDLLIDFPWKDEASRQNLIGTMITAIVAPAIEGNRPMTLIMASLERTGKTKLAEEVIGGVIVGKKTPAMQTPKEDNEMDKRITAALLRGDALLHLDNIREFMDSASLCSLLTAETYRGRRLGQSELVDLPNTLTLIGTGNNVKATGEIVKRTVPIRLQPRTDSPELRTDFVHPDLWQYVKDTRRGSLACVIGMVLNWVKAGKPRGKMPMGGFDQWAAVVGGVMQVQGYDSWLTNAAEWRQASDPRRSDLQALVKEWHGEFGTQMATGGELLAIAQRCDLFNDVLDPGKSDKANQTAFGMRILARHVDTPVGDWVIHKSDLTRPALYFLRPIESVNLGEGGNVK